MSALDLKFKGKDAILDHELLSGNYHLYEFRTIAQRF